MRIAGTKKKRPHQQPFYKKIMNYLWIEIFVVADWLSWLTFTK
jgi:hypothetical protein